MEQYIINYHTGIKDEVEVENLEEAMSIAQESMRYTESNVTIETLEGEVLVTSCWRGLPSEVDETEEEDVLVDFGNFGYYKRWL